MSNNVNEMAATFDLSKLNELYVKFEETFTKKITSVTDVYNDATFSEFKGSDLKVFQFELLELVKLQKLIKARVTKFGLLLSELYKSENNEIKCFHDKVNKALYEEYLELQNNFYYSISVLKCIKHLEINNDETKMLERVGYPALLIKNIEENLFTLYTVLREMNKLYKNYLLFSKNLENKNETELTALNNEKLLLVGKIWTITDTFSLLSNNWKKLYTDLLTNFGVKLIEDIMEEIKEFRENPEDFINQNEEDPFGINSDFASDEEQLEETFTDEQSQQVEKAIEIFDKSFINKLKLIKLLFTTTKKFIQDITVLQLEKQGNVIYSNLHKLISTMKEIVKQLDSITIDVMENQELNLSELNPLVNAYKRQLKLISNSNKNFEMFINTWNIKYNE